MSDQARITEVLDHHRYDISDPVVHRCICGADIGRDPDAINAHRAAEIVAALHPRIDTVDQLDALPFLTIVREVYGPSPSGCDYGAVWERRTSGWHCIAGSVMPPRDEHAPRLGCRVLYHPESS